ncbi:hypothetical protein JYU29_17060 [Tianweitania sp. BSSL-BM11]|uniref:Uncharacterized protein n=1 Tax=Tianweitania aestuarii TaxID=2814886 RepID=A0ABS5S024_9HYPH|nr:hypothetical protein [Tianweitania aestuarii]
MPPEPSRHEAFFSACRSVLVRSALLFSTAGVALTLFLAPMMVREERGAIGNPGIDYTATGSIGSAGDYTIRRSVLSRDPSGVCVIRSDGRQVGDC